MTQIRLKNVQNKTFRKVQYSSLRWISVGDHFCDCDAHFCVNNSQNAK